MKKQAKAVVLISGGLDSMLAAKVVMEQGVHVEGINFYTGFCVEGHTHAIRNKDQARPKRNNALWVAEQLGIKLHIIDVVEPYKEVLLHPKHGYGSNMNPCLDCKVFMVQQARLWCEQNSFDFIITGEVVGQRPMSQRKATMPIVAKESGADEMLLRPLSAKNLPATLAERQGWIKREDMYDFSGRSRKPQFALAAKFGFTDYASPSGGCCFLTDESYSRKLTDLWQGRGSRDYEMDDIMLLKIGRHFRISEKVKVIVSRDDGENNYMMGYHNSFIHLEPVSHGGPLALIDGEPTEAEVQRAAAIIGRYSKGKHSETVTVAVTMLDGTSRNLVVAPLTDEAMLQQWAV